MQKDIGQILAQSRLLALYAAIEAARAGEAGERFAVQAGELGRMVHGVDCAVQANGNAEDPLQEIESRLDRLHRKQCEINTLAGKIATSARRVTDSLQFEDVESKVVVYSKQRAGRLRALVSQIEARHGVLEAELSVDQNKIKSKRESFGREIAAMRDAEK